MAAVWAVAHPDLCWLRPSEILLAQHTETDLLAKPERVMDSPLQVHPKVHAPDTPQRNSPITQTGGPVPLHGSPRADPSPHNIYIKVKVRVRITRESMSGGEGGKSSGGTVEMAAGQPVGTTVGSSCPNCGRDVLKWG